MQGSGIGSEDKGQELRGEMPLVDMGKKIPSIKSARSKVLHISCCKGSHGQKCRGSIKECHACAAIPAMEVSPVYFIWQAAYPKKLIFQYPFIFC